MELKVVDPSEENHDEMEVNENQKPDNNACSRSQAVLTHLIDGFIIEESLSPFKAVVGSVLSAQQLHMIRVRQQEILAKEREAENTQSTLLIPKEEYFPNQDTSATCERCGFNGAAASFSSLDPSYCSLTCARKYSSVHVKRGHQMFRRGSPSGRRGRRVLQSRAIYHRRGRGRGYGIKTKVSRLSPSRSMSDSSFSEYDLSSEDESVFSYSPTPSPEPTIPHDGEIPRRPMLWSVDDVWRFIRSLPDSVQHAEDFRAQEIDGSALLLLHEEHLIGSMNFPLGPALKLCAHIDRLRNQEMH